MLPVFSYTEEVSKEINRRGATFFSYTEEVSGTPGTPGKTYTEEVLPVFSYTEEVSEKALARCCAASQLHARAPGARVQQRCTRAQGVAAVRVVTALAALVHLHRAHVLPPGALRPVSCLRVAQPSAPLLVQCHGKVWVRS